MAIHRSWGGRKASSHCKLGNFHDFSPNTHFKSSPENFATWIVCTAAPFESHFPNSTTDLPRGVVTNLVPVVFFFLLQFSAFFCAWFCVIEGFASVRCWIHRLSGRRAMNGAGLYAWMSKFMRMVACVCVCIMESERAQEKFCLWRACDVGRWWRWCWWKLFMLRNARWRSTVILGKCLKLRY